MTKEFLTKIKELAKYTFNIQETLLVLKQNLSIFWSWGAHNFTNIENKGLLFKVNGHHHKGWVLITLESDMYIVYIIDNKGTVLDKYDMVFFDDLVTIIDERIEKVDNYRF